MKPEEHNDMRQLICRWGVGDIERLRGQLEELEQKRKELDNIIWILEKVYSFQTSQALEKMEEAKNE